jgi:uncharacterized membrane protein
LITLLSALDAISNGLWKNSLVLLFCFLYQTAIRSKLPMENRGTICIHNPSILCA